ncbi:MAG: methylated-DNA--[protein]-cysteine S-methyltransferase [Limnobacter sp.]|nr:methylated-DNA--[protein]-cysteine S-methyltransferase [Limnobacter sp.]
MNDEQSPHYELVAKAIAYIRAQVKSQPSLEEVAAAVQVSPSHLQRLFTEWAGVSPKRYLQFLTKEYAKQQLKAAGSVLDVTLDSGLSSTSRLHDLMVSCEAMTPGEIKAQGLSLKIGYGFAATPFGPALIAWTPKGLCHFAFCVEGDLEAIARMQSLWPLAAWFKDDGQAVGFSKQIFPVDLARGKIHLVLQGTNFQIKVWEALIQTTSKGDMLTYQQLAQRMGSPKASRAVGGAMAANTIGYLIPCHRVIREGGDVGHYRWGSERKLAILGWEAAQKASNECMIIK